MAEKQDEKILGTLSAGSSPVIHVVEQSDFMVRIESADNPQEFIDVIKNSLPTLIRVLEDVSRQVNHR
jgi:hypothetical protein